MQLVKHNKWQRIMLPGFIFQSMVIGGGYGTGAEMAEYFGVNGVMGGLLTALTVIVVWGIICAVTYEFARLFKVYDYHSLTHALLGRASILYELVYVAACLMVLGVVVATSGNIFESIFGLNRWVGSIILAVLICVFIIAGTKVVEDVFAYWSYALYLVYGIFFIIVFARFGSQIGANIAVGEVKPTWFSNGVSYASYNLGIVAALLYSTAGCKSRKEAIASGFMSGVIAVIPALLLFLSLSAFYPEFLSLEVPVNLLFEKLDLNWLYYAFEIVLFGTLIETGMGFIKAVVDRVEVAADAKRGSVSKWIRPGVTIGLMVIGLAISRFGITAIILKGYGSLPLAYLITLIIPLFTVGIYKIVKYGKGELSAEDGAKAPFFKKG